MRERRPGNHEVPPSLPSHNEIYGQRDKVRTALTRLETGIAAILDSDSYKAYLTAMSRFHRYSYANVALIHAQRPDATAINSYNRWKQLGRQVRKGEHGIAILFPMFLKRDEDQSTEDDRQPMGYGVGYVFDVSQTEGKALPEPPAVREIKGSSEQSAVLWGYLDGYLTRQGVTIAREPMPKPGMRGYCDPERKHIGVSVELEDDHAAKTLTHEAAHLLTEHLTAMPTSDRETIAEGSAYVVLQHLGIDTSEYSFGYVAGWATDTAILKRNLDTIQKIATQIIDGVEGVAVSSSPGG